MRSLWRKEEDCVCCSSGLIFFVREREREREKFQQDWLVNRDWFGRCDESGI